MLFICAQGNVVNDEYAALRIMDVRDSYGGKDNARCGKKLQGLADRRPGEYNYAGK